jgi:drug/metabolite transporter (DMT)-like permease
MSSTPTETPGLPQRPASRGLGILGLVALGPLFGYGWVTTKIALAYSQLFLFTAIRATLTAFCLFLVMALMRRPLRPPPLVYTAVIGLLHTTGFLGLAMLALHSGGAGKVAVLTYTMSFWLVLLAWPFLGERVRGAQWLAVAFAFAGLVLVVAPWQISGVASSLLAVASGLAWAASAVVVKLMQRRHHVDPLSLTAWQIAVGSVPLVVIAVVTYGGGPEWTASFAWSLAYTVLLAGGVAQVLWLYTLRAFSADVAGLGALAAPVFGVLAAWLQLGERPSGVEAVGMALIIGGLAVLAAHGLAAARRKLPSGDGERELLPASD